MQRSHSCAILLGAALTAVAIPLTAQAPQAGLRATDAPDNGVWIDGLDLARAQIRRPRAQRGQPPPPPLKLALGGVEYPHGVPLQVNADLVIDLKGGATRFVSMVGIDDERKAGQGYTYVNIDDAWEAGWRKGPNGRNDPAAGRDANGEILTNEKFPDMKGLVDYIHSNGLKAGIYSGPGNTTCQGLAASFGHEEQDARTWARWGVDYIKYDWCGYPERANTNSPRDLLQKPYILMRSILDTLDRDVVYSLCQYGWGSVWEWGDLVGGNLWRVTGDITDTWSSMSSIGFAQTGHEQYAGPGHWNDTDMLVVGKVGWGSTLRDLWRHQDMGSVTDTIALEVARHGVAFLKVGKPRQ